MTNKDLFVIQHSNNGYGAVCLSSFQHWNNYKLDNEEGAVCYSPIE